MERERQGQKPQPRQDGPIVLNQVLRHAPGLVEASGAIEVEIVPARECRTLAGEWRMLEPRADGSFYLTWLWIGSWLAELPAEIEPLCLRARCGGETVGLALLTPRPARRHGIIASRELYLHATGDARFDQLTIEYNDFLVDRRLAEPVRRAMMAALAERSGLWDELLLDGIVPALGRHAAALGGRLLLRYRSRYPYFDFAATGGADCIEGLGRNTRHQIRRTQRLCGDPKLEIATNSVAAAVFFDGLTQQHTALWESRGKPGAFSNEFLLAFHRRLIADGVARGLVQLLRSRAGDGGIMGHLYNFVHRGRVCSYQSGFARYADKRVKPGLLSHYLAMEMNRRAGQRCYDFMAVDMRYKRSLSNREAEMIWVTVQRPALRFTIEHGVRLAKRQVARGCERALRLAGVQRPSPSRRS